MPVASFTASQASHNLSSRYARWPDDAEAGAGRLAGLVGVEARPGFTLVPGETIFTVGSCFARNIETRLCEMDFDVITRRPDYADPAAKENHFLNKYTPHSILNEFRWALEPGEAFPASALLQTRDGQWHDPHSAPFLPFASLEVVQERRRKTTMLYREVARCRTIIMTLGLIECWFDCQTGLYLNGTPRKPLLQEQPDRFRLDILSPQEIEETLEKIVTLLQRHGAPDFRMIATVSPVPLNATYSDADVLAANCYSKSALRAALEGVVRRHKQLDYFPSYESVLLTERSMAFNGDNRHASAEMVDAIMDRVIRAYLPRAIPPGQPEEISDEECHDIGKRARKTLSKGEYDKAAKALKLLSGDGRWAAGGYREFDFRMAYGEALLRTDKPVAAEFELKRALVLNNSSAEAHMRLGRAYKALGRKAEATRAFQSAATIDPERPRYTLGLAKLKAAMGDMAEAERLLFDFTTRFPDNEDAAALLRELRAKGLGAALG